MKPREARVVPERVWEIFNGIKALIEAMPDEIEMPAYMGNYQLSSDTAKCSGTPNCHMIVRALAEFFPVKVHDGYIVERVPLGLPESGCAGNNHYHHSWLTVIDEDATFIIDPWPLGVVTGPALFIRRKAFRFDDEHPFPELEEESFIGRTKAVITAMQAILNRSITVAT